MTPSLTRQDSSGTIHLRAGAIPLVVAAIAVPIVLALLLGLLAVGGTGLGLAAGALAIAALLVLAVRAKPLGGLQVATREDAERRLLVVAEREVTPEAAERIAASAGDAADVRLVVPIPSRTLDRWLSAEDEARAQAQSRLAHAAGALVAAGLPVSGSLGDSDSVQALEDELRSFPADEVLVISGPEDGELLGRLEGRLDLPVRQIPG